MIVNPAKPPAIDWSLYKKTIPIPGMVDNFHKQYEGLKVPFPTDSVTQKVVEQEKQVIGDIAEFKKASDKRIEG